MKRFTAIFLAMTIALCAFATLTFAAGSDDLPVAGEPFDEEPVEEPVVDETTFRAYTYDETAAYSPSVWLNSFDTDGECTGMDYVIFNCAAPLKAIGFPEVYAGLEENLSDCTVRFELFKWDTDADKTVKGDPVLSKDVYFNGDSKELPYFPLEQVQPAGQYLFRVSQLTEKIDDDHKPYSVLPISEMKYSAVQLEYADRGPFIFFIDCEKTEGVEDYFLKLTWKEAEIDIQPEKTIIPRGASAAHPIFEYGIVTPVVPDGQVLYSLALIEAPTWINKNHDSDVTFEVYKWTGDYEETLLGDILLSGELFDHADNTNLTLTFGTTMRYGNRYLLVIYRSNNGAIGYYEGVTDYPDGWEFYDYGIELDISPAIKVAYANVGDLGPEPTEVPTQEPTEAPTDAPATDAPSGDAATDVPVNNVTPDDAAKATDGGGKTDGDNSEKKGDSALPVIIGICCAAAVAIAVAVIVISKKKKKA